MLTRWFDSPTWTGLAPEFALLRSLFDTDFPGISRKWDSFMKQPAGLLGPRFDIKEDAEQVNLRVPMPGVSDKDLKIVVQGSTLTLKGEQTNPVPEGYRPLLRERNALRFEQSFTLSNDLDGSRTEARLVDGMLAIRIPRRKESQPRTIEVSVS